MFIFNAIATLACGLAGTGAAFAFWLDSYITEKKTSIMSCFSLASFSKALFTFCSQAVSCHGCLLPCILSSFFVYNIPSRLFSG